MASKQRRPTPSRTSAADFSVAELEGAVVSVLGAAPGLNPSKLKAALRKRGLSAAQALAGVEVARGLALSGRLHRYVKGKTEALFANDPVERLDQCAAAVLAGDVLRDTEFKRNLEKTAPGHKPLIVEWLKGALARRVLFEQADPAASADSAQRAVRSKAKFYGNRPDLRRVLKKALLALKAEVAQADALDVSRQELLAFLARELGVEAGPAPRTHPTPSAAPSSDGSQRELLAALQRLATTNPQGALLAVRELRALSGLDKLSFDAAALALAANGAIVLHHHNHAAALPDAERRQLIEDGRGTFYVGIAHARSRGGAP
jgi:hypothetical protein